MRFSNIVIICLILTLASSVKAELSTGEIIGICIAAPFVIIFGLIALAMLSVAFIVFVLFLPIIVIMIILFPIFCLCGPCILTAVVIVLCVTAAKSDDAK